MARFYDSYLNPLQMVEVDREALPQYMSRAMDNFLVEERLNRWQQMPAGKFYQPWVSQDVVSLQYQTNAGQLAATVINCTQSIQQAYLMQQKQQNTYQPDYFIYECNAAMNALPVGEHYFMVVEVGNTGKAFISEAFTVQTVQADTLLIEYTNRKYYGNFVFETGITPSIRVPGIIQLKTPASKDTVYEDQVLDMVMVQSKPYRLWNLIIGTPEGVPDWMVDKLNWILGCSSVKIDGRQYTKNEGAKLEESNPIGNGVFKTYSIELRESIMRNSKIFDTVADTSQQLAIVLNTNSKGFADTNQAGSSTITSFIDVE